MKQSATDLKVGGLTRLSTCDWPGELAATVFCQGCPWDCPYCHNPGLRSMQGDEQIPWDAVLDFLLSRRGLLDAVVFSGGEPILQPRLLDAVAEARALGFRIGLHTTGMFPERFAALLPLLDWVGFDVKAPFAEYARIAGIDRSGENALKSLRRLLASGIPYEVRTTVHPSLLSTADMVDLKTQLLDLGVETFAVQQYRPQGSVPGRLPHVADSVALPRGYGGAFSAFRMR